VGKSNKSILRWVERVGSLVTGELERRLERPFQFHQSGPYTQAKHPMVEVFFNEASFGSVPRASPTDKYDDRFGFVIRNAFLKDFDEWILFAGFALRNKVIARHAFVPNLALKRDQVAARLWAWIQDALEDGVFLSFDQIAGGKYIFNRDHSFEEFSDALSKFADLERKSSGIHRDLIAGWSGTDFYALQSMPQFDRMSNDERLFASAEEIAASAMRVFDRLSFLYDLLHLSVRPILPVKTGTIGPPGFEDERRRALAMIVQRQGQGEFRAALLRAYNRCCAITGCDVEQALDAAHILPYSGPQSNLCSNGLLLRADLHNLFDLGLLRIDPEQLTVSLAPQLQHSCYRDLDGIRLTVPDCPTERPNPKALKERFELLVPRADE
jgi:hypothetical protein